MAELAFRFTFITILLFSESMRLCADLSVHCVGDLRIEFMCRHSPNMVAYDYVTICVYDYVTI